MLSERGHCLKVVNQHKYRKVRCLPQGVKWRCTVKNCCCFIITDVETENILLTVGGGEHKHEVSKTLPRQIVTNAMRVKMKHKKDNWDKQTIEQLANDIVPLSLKSKFTSTDIMMARKNYYGKRKLKKSKPQSMIPNELYQEQHYLVVNESQNIAEPDPLDIAEQDYIKNCFVDIDEDQYMFEEKTLITNFNPTQTIVKNMVQIKF